MKEDLIITLNTLEDTNKLASNLKLILPKSIIVLLNGELGSGKTKLTSYLASQYQIEKNIKSPTYTILVDYHNEYVDLYHFDMYRLDVSNLIETEPSLYESIVDGIGIKIIEWPKELTTILNHYLLLDFRVIDELREVKITTNGIDLDLNKLKL
jgi:tRNA threonylcarbamoyladenosine biosynthesis protein TsaE